jgi:hypothetical protein
MCNVLRATITSHVDFLMQLPFQICRVTSNRKVCAYPHQNHLSILLQYMQKGTFGQYPESKHIVVTTRLTLFQSATYSSSFGGSIHRPWSLMSWTSASVAPSIGIALCTTSCRRIKESIPVGFLHDYQRLYLGLHGRRRVGPRLRLRR